MVFEIRSVTLILLFLVKLIVMVGVLQQATFSNDNGAPSLELTIVEESSFSHNIELGPLETCEEEHPVSSYVSEFV